MYECTMSLTLVDTSTVMCVRYSKSAEGEGKPTSSSNYSTVLYLVELSQHGAMVLKPFIQFHAFMVVVSYLHVQSLFGGQTNVNSVPLQFFHLRS